MSNRSTSMKLQQYFVVCNLAHTHLIITTAFGVDRTTLGHRTCKKTIEQGFHANISAQQRPVPTESIYTQYNWGWNFLEREMNLTTPL